MCRKRFFAPIKFLGIHWQSLDIEVIGKIRKFGLSIFDYFPVTIGGCKLASLIYLPVSPVVLLVGENDF
jgi:hypothetical protein